MSVSWEVMQDLRTIKGDSYPTALRRKRRSGYEVGAARRSFECSVVASSVRQRGLYGAKTTPHMFVIDPQGVLRYMGGIDDVPTARVEDLQRATQLADQALTELFAGKSVSVPTSRPYGCSVKYAS